MDSLVQFLEDKMSKFDKDKVTGWFTMNGKHIPIYNGETKADAIKRSISGKSPKFKSSSFNKTINKKGDIVKSDKNSDKDTSDAVKKVKKDDTKQTKSKVSSNNDLKQSSSKESKKKDSTEEKRQKQIADAKVKSDKLNADKKYEESLKFGNKVGIQNGHLTFKGKEVEKLNTSDIMSDKKKNRKGSMNDYVDKDGNVSPERLEVHRQIIEEYFGDHKPYKPGEEKKALFTGGGGASGKGTLFTKNIGKVYSSDDNPVIVDADELKNKLNAYDYEHGRFDGQEDKETYKQLNDVTTGWYHEESSALAKQIYKMCLDNDYPVLFDGTATNIDSTVEKIKQAEKAGYKTEMNFLFSDAKTVIANSLVRYMHTGRLVPITQQLKAHRNAFKAVLGIYTKFDNFSLWDNRVVGKEWVTNPKTGKKEYRDRYNQEKIAENHKNGIIKISNGKAWKFFQSADKEFDLYNSQIRDFYKSAKAVEDMMGWKKGKAAKWLKDHEGNNNLPNDSNRNKKR